MSSPVSDRFWQLVDENEIDFLSLGQIVSAPIKVLLQWHESEVPEQALRDLEQHLGVENEKIHEISDQRPDSI